MAKITVTGSAVVITSAVKYEDIEKVQKYRPDALTLKNEEKEPVFRIGVTDRGPGGIDKYGASFGGHTFDENRLATITLMTIGGDTAEEIKDAIADKYGAALLSINKIEATLPTVIDEINAERDLIRGAITVA